MNITRLLFCLLILCGLLLPARAADRTAIRAILVVASNDKGPSDKRLAAYEPTLRNILRFESYRFLGEGSATLDIPAKGALSLGQGHRLEVETENADKRTVHLRVGWFDGGRVLMRTVISQRPGVPTVLGGPSRGNGEVYAVIVIGR
jgi:hypothetical protein